MVSIERLIDEHRQVAVLGDALSRAAGDATASWLRATLVQLDTVLGAHLSTEDLEVYPDLLARGDESQRHAAATAMTDFNKLASEWQAYVARWTEAAIDADRAGFADDSARVLSSLAARIRIENEVLYPLALRSGTITLREARARINAS